MTLAAPNSVGTTTAHGTGTFDVNAVTCTLSALDVTIGTCKPYYTLLNNACVSCTTTVFNLGGTAITNTHAKTCTIN